MVQLAGSKKFSKKSSTRTRRRFVAGDRAEPGNKPRVWDLSKFSQPPVRISQNEFSLTPRREKRNAEHVTSLLQQCSGEQASGARRFRNEGDRDGRKTRCFSNEQHRPITSARAPGSTVVPLSPRALTRVIRKPRCRPGACPRRCAPRLRVSRRAHPGPSFASGKAGGGVPRFDAVRNPASRLSHSG